MGNQDEKKQEDKSAAIRLAVIVTVMSLFVICMLGGLSGKEKIEESAADSGATTESIDVTKNTEQTSDTVIEEDTEELTEAATATPADASFTGISDTVGDMYADASAGDAIDASALTSPIDVRLIMIGDNLLHSNVSYSGLRSDGTYNFDHLFTHVKEDAEAADIAVINQEVIFGGNDRGIQNYPNFNTRTEVADAIVSNGFNVVLHATNHVLDQGVEGLEYCLDYWNTNFPDEVLLGVHATEEEADDIYVYEKDGFKIALLNYTYDMNGYTLPSDKSYMVELMDSTTKDDIADDLARASEMSDFVVVFPHWGTEYMLEPTEAQEEWAQFFADNGADLIIGGHPHVCEPVRWIEAADGNRVLCYYSVGNFVSSQHEAESMLGIMADVTITRGMDGDIYISSYGLDPLVTHTLFNGYGTVTTYKLVDYNDDLAAVTRVRQFDSRFTTQFMWDLTDRLFGELYDVEARTRIPASEYNVATPTDSD